MTRTTIVISLLIFITAAPLSAEAPFTLKILQGTKQIAVKDNAEIKLERKPFSFIFPIKEYSNKGFKAVRATAWTDDSIFKQVDIGMSYSKVPFYAGGTGMACERDGRYPFIIVQKEAHHYLYYQKEDSHNHRVERLYATGPDSYMVYWSVQGIFLPESYEYLDFVSMSMSITELYLSFYADMNQNNSIDENELVRVKLLFDKYEIEK
jgi:hypothetical protein